MIDFYSFYFKNVSVVCNDGRKYQGVVDLVESPYENESNEFSIGIETHTNNKFGIELYESEIQSIQITS